jgi:DNA-binding NarL/FixJ family response regulator
VFRSRPDRTSGPFPGGTLTLAELAPVAVRARVLVVDDHRTFAELLSGALEAGGMTSVGVAGSTAQAVSMAEDLRPDIVVMDIQMGRDDGLAATRRIRELVPDTVVAVVTAHCDPDWVVRAAQAGASAFIPKNGSLAEMLDVLGRVRAGQMLVAPSTFAGGRDGSGPARKVAPELTRREQQVLDCLGQGMQVKAIARVLGITQETCRGYVKSLHVKLGARSQLEAVVKAQQVGLLGHVNEH